MFTETVFPTTFCPLKLLAISGDLSSTEFRVFLALLALADEDGQIFKTMDLFEEVLGLTRPKLSMIFKRLHDLGIIERTPDFLIVPKDQFRLGPGYLGDRVRLPELYFSTNAELATWSNHFKPYINRKQGRKKGLKS